MVPVFSENGLAISAGMIRCFHFDSLNYEYKGWTDEFIGVGHSLPMLSTDIDPGIEVIGKVSVFIGNGWELQADHRGEVVYSIADASSSVVDYIGDIRQGFVIQAPIARHDKWDGGQWVTDEAGQHSEDVEVATQFKRLLIEEARSVIVDLNSTIKLEMASDDEIRLVILWKQYWTLLLRIDVNDAPEISWPAKPKYKLMTPAGTVLNFR